MELTQEGGVENIIAKENAEDLEFYLPEFKIEDYEAPPLPEYKLPEYQASSVSLKFNVHLYMFNVQSNFEQFVLTS